MKFKWFINQQKKVIYTHSFDDLTILELTDSTSKTSKLEYDALQKKCDELRQVVTMHEESIKMKELEALKGILTLILLCFLSLADSFAR